MAPPSHWAAFVHASGEATAPLLLPLEPPPPDEPDDDDSPPSWPAVEGPDPDDELLHAEPSAMQHDARLRRVAAGTVTRMTKRSPSRGQLERRGPYSEPAGQRHPAIVKNDRGSDRRRGSGADGCAQRRHGCRPPIGLAFRGDRHLDIGDTQLAIAREVILSRWRDAMSTVEGAAWQYAMSRSGLSAWDPRAYPAQVAAVRVADIARVANQYLSSDALRVVLAGDDRWLDTSGLGLGDAARLSWEPRASRGAARASAWMKLGGRGGSARRQEKVVYYASRGEHRLTCAGLRSVGRDRP